MVGGIETAIETLRDLVWQEDPDLLPVMKQLEKELGEDQTTSGISLSETGLLAIREMGVSAIGVVALYHSFTPLELQKTLFPEQKFLRKLSKEIISIRNLNTGNANLQSENFMKFLLLISADLQSLLLVQAIKLWQLRNDGKLSPKIRQQLLHDLEHLYLPLSHRLGLYSIKQEMEDYLMLQQHPAVYKNIADQLQANALQRDEYIKRFITPLKHELHQYGIEAEIKYRVKSIPSIWKKMKEQKVSLEEIYDVFAVRIIDKGASGSEEKKRCWEIYSIITDLYPPDPSRLRDWISVPRSSGYESLHTTVLGPDQRWVEVQIRSSRMDIVAESGPAAHWRYKEKSRSGSDNWLIRARKILEAGSGLGLFNKETGELDKSADEIFTITPTGDLIKLKPEATVLDFAFEIHSEVGIRCKGAIVNGKITPIRHLLNNGDTVSIMTSSRPKVGEDWLQIATTTKARQRIRKALKESKEEEYLEGKELLERKVRQWKTGTLEEHIRLLMQHYKIKDVITLYTRIADGSIQIKQIKELITNNPKEHHEKPVQNISNTGTKDNQRPREDVLLINNEMSTTDYTLAGCCHPVFGDPVFGFVTVGKGIKIHRNTCPNAIEMKTRYPYRIISVRWAAQEDFEGVRVALKLTGRDRIGLVGEITDLLNSDTGVVIRMIQFSNGQGKFQGHIRLMVKDKVHLGWVVRKISRVSGVEKVNESLL